MKRIVFFLLLFCLLGTTACASDYTSHWAYADMQFLQEEGLITVAELTQNPDDGITRKQFLTMLFSAMLSPDIANLHGGLFDCDFTVTREDGAVMIVQALKIKNAGTHSIAFIDEGKIMNKEQIYRLVEAGLLFGYEDGTFRPDALMTLGEGTTIIKRILDQAKALTDANVEIERKFLINPASIPYDLQKADIFEIEQTYVSFEPEVRVRRLNGWYYSMAVKLPKDDVGLVRREVEIYILRQEYEHLMKYQAAPTVEKTRYQFMYQSKSTAVDIYRGRHEGLAVSEIEFGSREAADAFVPYEWYLKDVTSDSRYKNANLAKDGKPE